MTLVCRNKVGEGTRKDLGQFSRHEWVDKRKMRFFFKKMPFVESFIDYLKVEISSLYIFNLKYIPSN